MEKKLLVDCINFNVNPEIVTESMQRNNGKLLVQGVIQRANALNQNKRFYPKSILMREVEKYQQFVKERRALGELDHPECHRSSAEVYTRNGWKFIKDVYVDDEVLTLNTNTNFIEWQKIIRTINEPYIGKMISIKGKNIDVLVTPNHKFVLKNRNNEFVEKTALELFELSTKMISTHLSIPITGTWMSHSISDTFEIPAVNISKYAKEENKERQKKPLIVNAKCWFSFLGFYLAEGHCSHENNPGYEVTITQMPGKKLDEFKEILNNLSSELVWKEHKKTESNCITLSISDARLWTYVNSLGNKYTKHIPQEIKDAPIELLELLFKWFLLGDGSTVISYGYERQSVFSVSKRLIEDLNEILIKLGGVGVIKEQISKKDYIYAEHIIKIENKSTLYRLWIKRSSYIHLDFRFIEINEVDYDSTVHCITVNNGNFYCRDNKKPFWSGNSSVINLSNVSHLITELWWEGDDLIGKLEILSTPSGNILRELFKSGISVGISSRGLGSTKEIGEGAVEVDEDFEILGWDCVSNPSTQGSFIRPISESVNNELSLESNKYLKVNNIIMDILTSLSSK